MNKICKEPLFDFHLDLIEDCCKTTDTKEKIITSWYYLSCGYYRIVAGDDLLLNYSHYQVDQWKQNPSVPGDYFYRTLQKNYLSYVDYFVERLWEDLIGMLHIIREPLPKPLESIMNNPIGWRAKAEEWLNTQPEDNHEAWDIYDQGGGWLSARSLDNGYLDPSSAIYIYLSADDMINLVWDNQNKKIQNLPAWSSQSGKFSLTKIEFFEEVQLFNDRFINQMADRIEWVINNWNDRAKYANLDDLRQQHKLKSDYLSKELSRRINNENFDEVFKAIEKMGIGYGL